MIWFSQDILREHTFCFRFRLERSSKFKNRSHFRELSKSMLRTYLRLRYQHQMPLDNVNFNHFDHDYVLNVKMRLWILTSLKINVEQRMPSMAFWRQYLGNGREYPNYISELFTTKEDVRREFSKDHGSKVNVPGTPGEMAVNKENYVKCNLFSDGDIINMLHCESHIFSDCSSEQTVGIFIWSF